MDKKPKKDDGVQIEIAVNYTAAKPETVYDLINKYGTYEIQPTADTPNDFPKIAQGLPKGSDKKSSDKN